MRPIFFAVAFAVTASIALAQKPNPDSIWIQPCSELYAPWGASRSTVMAAAKAAGFTFGELDHTEDQVELLHISYVDGDYRRMFSFAHGEYIGYTIVYGTSNANLRNRITNKHLGSYLAIADSIESAKSLYIMCGDQKMRSNIINNSSAVSIQILNHTAMTNAIIRFREKQ